MGLVLRALFWGIIGLSGLSACGYRIGYSLRSLPGGYDHVAIPIFNNLTKEVGIETYFTNAIIEEFERSGIARVTSKAQAPVTLQGAIASVRVMRSAEVPGGEDSEVRNLPNNTALATEYRIVVTSRLELVRNSDQAVLWGREFRSEVVYSAPRIGSEFVNSANANYNKSARNQNIVQLAGEMMEEAHDRITENF